MSTDLQAIRCLNFISKAVYNISRSGSPYSLFEKTLQVVFTALLACAAAAPGLIGSPYGYAAPLASPWGHGVVGAPLLSAPVVKTVGPVATSYANSVRVSTFALFFTNCRASRIHWLVCQWFLLWILLKYIA